MFLKFTVFQPLVFSSQTIATARRHSSRSAHPSQRAKQHSRRGGQNLSERYIRLEKSLRGKEALEAEREELHRSALDVPISGKPTAASRIMQSFRGLVIPEKPKEPQSDACCMSGCAVCVYDLYEDSLTEYRKALAQVAATLHSMGVPEPDWPRSLRSSSAQTEKTDVTLSVFEQMELEMQRRKQAEMVTMKSPSFEGSESELLRTRGSSTVVGT